MTEQEKRLGELLISIKKDKMFVMSIMALAKETGTVRELADMIEECEIKEEHDLYDAIFAETDSD